MESADECEDGQPGAEWLVFDLVHKQLQIPIRVEMNSTTENLLSWKHSPQLHSTCNNQATYSAEHMQTPPQLFRNRTLGIDENFTELQHRTL